MLLKSDQDLLSCVMQANMSWGIFSRKWPTKYVSLLQNYIIQNRESEKPALLQVMQSSSITKYMKMTTTVARLRRKAYKTSSINANWFSSPTQLLILQCNISHTTQGRATQAACETNVIAQCSIFTKLLQLMAIYKQIITTTNLI